MSNDNSQLNVRQQAKLNMHKMFLEALRHREQDIVRFLAILGPALGGFIWLLREDAWMHPAEFVSGTYGVLFVLVMGAFYALALGYNYRYLTLHLAKLESEAHLGLKGVVLTSWPHWPKKFENRNRLGVIPWCTPPGIIKVFWVAFLAGILGVTIMASHVSIDPPPDAENLVTTRPTEHMRDERAAHQQTTPMKPFKEAIPWAGGICFLLALLWPVSVGRKMLKACRKENPNEWGNSEAKEKGEANEDNLRRKT